MSDSKDRSYLGIDVSKGYADFCLMGEDGTVWEETVLDDTDRGHTALRELLGQALTRSESLEVGLEATGGYERDGRVRLSPDVAGMGQKSTGRDRPG